MALNPSYMVLKTDRRCVIAGRPRPDIPLLLRRDGTVVEAVSDWLRRLCLGNEKRSGELAGTADRYARILQSFLTYLESIGVDWRIVSDATLERWANDQLLKRPGPRKSTINMRLSVVVRFYRWAQRDGGYPGVVDVVRQLPDGRKAEPDITLEARVRERRTTLVPAVLLDGSDERFPRETPTRAQADEMELAVRRLVELPELKDRNVLILRWAGYAGCRRKELRSLRIGQFRYSEREIQEIGRSGRNIKVRVWTKKHSYRIVHVPHELLRATIQFIQTSRATLVARARYTDQLFRDPGYIFLGEGGQVLELDTLTRIGSAAARAVGLTKASLHRLRSLYAIELFRSEYLLLRAAGLSPSRDTILARIADRMGHGSFRSLEPYLRKIEREYSHSDYELEESVEAHRALDRVRELAQVVRSDPRWEANAATLLRNLVATVPEFRGEP